MRPITGAAAWETILRAILSFMLIVGLYGVARAAPPPDAPATSATPAAPSSIAISEAALAAQVDQAQAALQAVTAGIRQRPLSDQEISERLAAIPPIQARLNDAVAALTPRLAAVDARLAQLGPAPAPGQPPEAADIAQNRRDLARFRQDVDSEIKQAGLLSVETGQTSGFLTSLRREQFSARLWTRSHSVLDPGLWTAFAKAQPRDAKRLAKTAADEAHALRAAASPATLVWWIAAAVLAVLIAFPGRMALNRLAYGRVAALMPPTRLKRTGPALWLVAAGTLTWLAACDIVRAALAGANALTDTAAGLAGWLIVSIMFAAFFESLGRALLAPDRPSWRLAPVPDDIALRLALFPGLIGMAAGLAAFLRNAGAIFDVELPVSQAAESVALLLEIGVAGGALFMAGRARSEHLAQAVDQTTPHEAGSRLPWVIAALLAWLTLGAAILAAVAGYLALATFLMRNLIWIATVLASLSLLLKLADDIFPALFSPTAAAGRFIRLAIGVSEPVLEQFAVLLSGLTRLALLLFGWAAILAPFGDSAGAMAGRIATSKLSFKIGQVSISPAVILGAVAVFLVGLAVTRAVRGWLEQRYLPTTRLDVGLRTSVSAGVTYFGALVAILLTCGYLGLSLDKIALFASALSVGIGFGLQAVIGNFVSGLILLAERPVKVGDWIAIGDLEGDVKRINVRATEIEMQDRSKLIVPNSDLISKTVRNVTQGGSIGRVRINLKVVDTADPAQVRDLLLARITGHEDVLEEPAVGVYLMEAREGALEFSCFFYVSSPRLAARVKSELLFQIVPDLRAAGVQLANSTPVVNVGLPTERLIEPTPEPEG